MANQVSGENNVRRRRFERSEPVRSLTPVKLDVLRTITEAKFLSTPQVAEILGLSERAVRSHLRDLFDMGHLDVMSVPGAAVGSSALMSPKIHIPTTVGLKLLDSLGILPVGAERPTAFRPERFAFVAHELCVRDFFVWLRRSARELGHCVEMWDCSRFATLGDARPDAVFAYDDGEGIRAGALECDMGTERGVSGGGSDRWAAKIAAYSDALFDPEITSAFGYENPGVVVTVGDVERARWIAKRIKGTPLEERVLIARRSDLTKGNVLSPAWRQVNGDYRALVKRLGEETE